jgi:hypothetical protein
MADSALMSRPSWAEADPSSRQRQLLEVLYDAFPVNEQGSWPSYAHLEAVLRRNFKLDARQLLTTMPIGLLWPDPAFGSNLTEEQEFAVTVFGLTFVPKARSHLDLFVRIVAWGAERRADFLPPLQGRATLEVPSEELVRDLQSERRLVEPATLAKTLALARNEPGVPTLAGNLADGEFRIHVPREVLEYQGITTLDEFFERRPQQPLMQRRVDVNGNAADVFDLGDPSDEPRPSSVAALAHSDLPETTAAEPEGPAALDLAPHAVGDLPAAADQLGFAPIVRGIVDLVNSEQTTLPLTLAVSGPWGAGKSSLMRQIADALEDSRGSGRIWHIAEFDAWKYEQSDALWAALTKTIYETELPAPRCVVRRFLFRSELEIRRHGRLWPAKLVAALALPLAALAYAALRLYEKHQLGGWISGLVLIATAGALTVQRWTNVSTLVFDPFKRALALYTVRRRFEDRLGFSTAASRDVEALVQQITKDGKEPLAVFIDDLDRCTPTRVAEVVEAINQIFNASEKSRVLFVLGMDMDVVAASLQAAYEATVRCLPLERRINFGRDYLHKIAQLFISVPEPSNEAFESLLRSLGATELDGVLAAPAEIEVLRAEAMIEAAGPETLEETSRVGERLASSGEASLAAVEEAVRRERAKRFGSDREDVLRAEGELLPLLVRSPRALKSFDRAYRLQLHVANNSPHSVLTFDYDQLVGLGKWVILNLRWPNIARAIRQDSSLVRELESVAISSVTSGRAVAEEQWPTGLGKPDPDLVRLFGANDESKFMSKLPLTSFLDVS